MTQVITDASSPRNFQNPRSRRISGRAKSIPLARRYVRRDLLREKKWSCSPCLAHSHQPVPALTCRASRHNYDEFKALGVDEVYCLSVNDAFTMFQWGKHQGVENVKLLPDGSGEFSRLMGMLVHKDNLGFGERSWRYSMLVDDGEITAMFEEPGKCDNCPSDPFEASDADTMLNFIKAN